MQLHLQSQGQSKLKIINRKVSWIILIWDNINDYISSWNLMLTSTVTHTGMCLRYSQYGNLCFVCYKIIRNGLVFIALAQNVYH